MTTKSQMPQVCLRVPRETLEEIDQAAQMESRTRSGQILHILKSALGRSTSQRPLREREPAHG